jgi:ABC-type Fe3+-hydroxamate transport system substrate-binding protein
MMTFTDQMGHSIFLQKRPTRIISLVPSQTELLFDLGLANRMVGITKFCIHPAPKPAGITVVGGTKNFNFDTIHRLQPDLIIGNKEENYLKGIQELQQHYPVWMSDIVDLSDALTMIECIGQITGTTAAADTIKQNITRNFSGLKVYPAIPAAYFIWKDPYMSVGQDTFIHQMLVLAGFNNVFAHLMRYPVVVPDALEAANPTVILLSSEPYPFKEKHLLEFQQICPRAIVKLVDGELFSWYGSRLLNSPAYFKQLRTEMEAARLAKL